MELFPIIFHPLLLKTAVPLDIVISLLEDQVLGVARIDEKQFCSVHCLDGSARQMEGARHKNGVCWVRR